MSCFKTASFVFSAIGSMDVMLNCLIAFRSVTDISFGVVRCTVKVAFPFLLVHLYTLTRSSRLMRYLDAGGILDFNPFSSRFSATMVSISFFAVLMLGIVQFGSVICCLGWGKMDVHQR